MACFFFSSAHAQTYHQVIEAVRINQQDLRQVSIFLQDENNNLFISEEDLKGWRIIPPKFPPVTYFGKNYYPVYAFKGASYKIDARNTTLDLFIPVNFMQKNIIDVAQSQFRIPTKPDFGAFLNYDALGQVTYDSINQQQIGGFFTPGIFTSYGNLTSSFVAQINNLNNVVDGNNNVNGFNNSNGNQFTRLNTTWETDFPESMKSLRLGDAYSTPGMWGRSVDFGGIQWGTNFSTQPMFLTFPTLSTVGQATVPSSVDLLINNSLVSSSSVNAGPFSINNIPTVSGAGTVNIVTTDALGRQQVINIPYYTSTNLLKQGLQSYSIELGSIRQNYGIDSNDYADFMLTGTDSIGITDNFTSEVHAEILTDQQTAGLGGTFLLGNFGVFNAAAAVSNSDLGVGGLAQLGFQRQSINGLSFGFNTQVTSGDFIQVGYTEDLLPPSLQNQVFVSMPIDKASLGLSYTQQNNRGANNANILSLSYSQNIFKDISLSVSAFTNVYGDKNRAVLLSLMKALTDRTTASVSGNAQQNNNYGSVQVTRNLPTDTGYGYDLLVTQGQQPNYQGALMGQTSTGVYTARAGYQNDATGFQLEANGGVVALDGGVFFTRFINSANSFAVVDVSGLPDVMVYNNNNPIGKTNSKGKAVVTDLLPYQDNKLEIQPNDVPLNTTINTTRLYLVPYSNSGVVVNFPVKTDHPATMTLINAANDQVIPMGAIVTLMNAKKNKAEYMVANDGELYIPDMDLRNVLLVKWDDTKCTATVNYPKTKDPMPNLGKIVCR